MTGTTHALLGIASYMTVKKNDLSTREKIVLFAAALTGSLIPDIDVIVQFTKAGQLHYQMWHRGITHSLVAIPIWASLITAASYLILKVRRQRVFWLSLITVTVHIFTDCLNSWGTGVFEPFSNIRVSFGVISFADQLIPGMVITGIIVTILRRKIQSTTIFRYVALAIGIYVLAQSALGIYIYQTEKPNYDRVMLAASQVPGQFRVIGQKNDVFSIFSGMPWVLHREATLESLPLTDDLLQRNKKAKILHTWAPALVLQDQGDNYIVFDPRFYRNGTSFLTETIPKHGMR